MDTKEIKELLKNNIVSLTFQKTDGTERKMRCTTNASFLPPSSDSSSSSSHKTRPEDLVVAYEIDVGWRSFYSSSIKNIDKIEIIENSHGS